MAKKSEARRSFRILTINPGSTSTKIGLYRDEEAEFEHSVRHSVRLLEAYKNIFDQYDFRKREILEALKERGVSPADLDCIVARGGLIKPIPSGVYAVDEQMIEDARRGVQGQHASNLGCVLAYGIGWERDIPCYIVDPPAVDEFEPLARLAGHAAVERKSLFHALNIFATARVYGREHGCDFRTRNLVIAHLGGGITVAALRQGRAINVNHGLEEGPYTPERSGQLPLYQFMKLCRSGEHDEETLKKMVAGKGGLTSYCQTNSATEVEALIRSGSERFRLVYEGMAYQIAEAIGARATNLAGRVDAVILTGGLAHSRMLTDWITERVSFIAPVLRYPGEEELRALALGGLRVMRGEETARHYGFKFRRVAICCWTSLDIYSRAVQVIENAFRAAGHRFRTGDDTVEIEHHNCGASEDKAREVAELYREQGVDLVFAVGSPMSARLAHYLRDTAIPVVFAGIHNPLVLGQVKWKERPGYNAVCYSGWLAEQIEAGVRPFAGKLSRLGMIYQLGELQSEIQLDEMRLYCQKHRIALTALDVQRAEEMEETLDRFAEAKVEWLVLGATTEVARLGRDFFDACRRRFPTLCPFEQNLRNGGFAGVLSSWDEVCEESARIGLQVLEDEDPPERMVQPKRARLVVNRETSVALRLQRKAQRIPGVQFV